MSSWEDTIKILVTARAKVIAEKRIEHIRKKVADATTLWWKQIRRNLSTPWPGGRNRTDTPYMRSGDLRNAIPHYKVTTRKTFNGSKFDLGQTVIHMKQNNPKPQWNTYGKKLNHWDSGLAGWQDRAYNALYKKIDEKLGFTKDHFIFN